MKFKSLVLRNWRSFLGEHRIDFAQGSTRNITVLVGQNGAGKTALLNAFTWALFGQTTAGFRQSDDLFNHARLNRLSPAEEARMEVTLKFEHDGVEYTVQRYQLAKHEPDGVIVGKPILSAVKRSNVAAPVDQEEINAILPPGLHPFFFFPAENIGKDINQNDAAAIRASMSSAIDVLLGIGRIDRARDIVSTALKSHLKVPRGGRDGALEEAERAMECAREAWEEKTQRGRELPDLIRRAEETEQKLNDEVSATEEFHKAFEEFQKIEREIASLEAQEQRAIQDQVDVLNNDCVVLFGQEIFATAKEVLDDALAKGEIPPRISAGLLEELLSEPSNCICGRPLGHDELAKLDALRAKTIEDFVAEQASDLRGRVPTLAMRGDKRRDEVAAKAFLDAASKSADAGARRTKLFNLRSEQLDKQPGLAEGGNPAKLRRAWSDAIRAADRLRAELGEVKRELKQLERTKDEAERELQKRSKKNATARSVGRAREMLSSIENALAAIQDSIRASAREDVQRAMNEFYGRLLLKNYRINLADDFRYEIRDPSLDRVVGASSSEVALATFAFVGALAGLMPVYADLENLIPRGDGASPGGLAADAARAYPVVLDAPYSPFGEDYSERFSERLPDLLPQSVLIIRADQVPYLKPMLDERRIGAAYALRLHSAKDESERTLKWGGDDFEYVVGVSEGEVPHTSIANLPVS